MRTIKSEKTTIRDLLLRHVDDVLTIERNCFPDPWQEDWFTAMIRTNILTWGCFVGGKLIGFLIAIPSGESIHLANIAIDYPYRRKGIARKMMKRLYTFAHRNGCRSITLEVRESNNSAIDFYKAEGFVKVGVHKGYYMGVEDALQFNLDISWS